MRALGSETAVARPSLETDPRTHQGATWHSHTDCCATLTAKPGKEQDLADFLVQGQSLAEAEEGTRTWYAFRIDDATFGIFDTFEDEDGRQAHLNGQIPQALGQVGPDLLAADPDIKPVDVLATKPA